MKTRLSNDFWLFQLGVSLAALATRSLQITVAWWALSKGESATLFSLLIATAIFVEIYARPLFSSVGDYFSRKGLVLSSLILGSACAFGFSAIAGLSVFPFWPATGLLVAVSFAAALREPIVSSILPMLVDRDRVRDAIGVRSTFGAANMLVGAGLGSLVLSVWGVSGAFIFSGTCFSIASGLVACIGRNTHPLGDLQIKVRIYLTRWLEFTLQGFSMLWRVRTEFHLASLAMLVDFALYPFFSVLVPMAVKQTLNGPAWYIGLFDGAFGVGIMAASLFLVKRTNSLIGKLNTVFLGFLLLGTMLIAFALVRSVVALTVVMWLAGIGLMLININTSSLRSLATPERFRSRMFAMVVFVSAALTPVGSVVIGDIADTYGTSYAILAGGLLITACAFVVPLIPNFKNVLSLADTDTEDYYLKTYPQAFPAFNTSKDENK